MMGRKDKVEALKAAAWSLKTQAGRTISTAGMGTATTGRDGGAQPQKRPEQMRFTFPPAENEKEQKAVIEAILFTMGNSVELRRLAVAIGQDQAVAKRAVERLMERCRRSKGRMETIQPGDNYQIYTKPDYYENLIRIAATPKEQILTKVVLEALSIIAYKQLVIKMEIEKIRGVKSSHAMNRLVEYNLVYEMGRLDAPGQPAPFTTTRELLRRFGVSSIQDLPDIDPKQETEIKAQMEKELQLRLEEAGLSVLEETAATKEE